MNYSDDAKYFQFIIENTIEAEKLRGFTNLLLIGEGVDYSNLQAIKEDVGDKIRNIWDKFMAFINRVWAKFMDYANRVIQGDQGYLEQYKDTILNKQPNDVDLEMRNYATGIHNMTTAVIPPFITVQNDIPVDAAVITFKQKLIPAYTDANKDWTAFCTAYFQGGEDKISTNLRQLNMTDLYNYCHDYKKIESVIQKDKDAITKTYQSVQNIITTAKNAAASATPAQPAATQAKPATPATPPAQPAQSATPPAQPAAPATPPTQPAAKPQEAVIDSYISTYFNEADDTRLTIGKPDANAAGNANATTNDNTKASANMQSVGNTPSGTPAAATQGQDLDELEKKIAQYNTTATGILTAKMTSAHIIYQDYMKLIKLHVGQQVGLDGNTKVATSGSNHDTGLNIAPGDADRIMQQVAAIDAETDANKKSTATQQLISTMQSKFPNFKGGLEDIRKAAVAAKGTTKGTEKTK